jgi:hypothetical protein
MLGGSSVQLKQVRAPAVVRSTEIGGFHVCDEKPQAAELVSITIYQELNGGLTPSLGEESSEYFLLPYLVVFSCSRR